MKNLCYQGFSLSHVEIGSSIFLYHDNKSKKGDVSQASRKFDNREEERVEKNNHKLQTHPMEKINRQQTALSAPKYRNNKLGLAQNSREFVG